MEVMGTQQTYQKMNQVRQLLNKYVKEKNLEKVYYSWLLNCCFKKDYFSKMVWSFLMSGFQELLDPLLSV